MSEGVKAVPVVNSSLVFDKATVDATNRANILLIDSYANAMSLCLMKRAARGQMPPNNFAFKFQDVGNMGMQAAIQSQPQQWMALQQANQALPAQPQQQVDMVGTVAKLDARLDDVGSKLNAIDAKFKDLK